MNEHLSNIIQAEYKQYGLYDVKIKKYISNKDNMIVFLDVVHKRNFASCHGYCKRIFYDYLSDSDIKFSLANYFYDTKRQEIEKEKIMSEKGIIVIGTIELTRYIKDGHLTKYYPSFLKTKSKFTDKFKDFILNNVKSIGVNKTLKDLSNVKGFKISRASIYNLIK